VPQLPLLPGTGVLPSTDVLPTNVSGLLPSAQLPTTQLPAVPSLDQANPTAALSQVTGLISGKAMHIQG
jgi:hypothetical protein